jgi:glucose/arabinose dehydrogenase
MLRRVLLAGCAAALVTTPAAAGGDGNDLIPDLPADPRSVTLTVVADVGPEIVIDVTSAGDGSGRLFLVSPDGVIRILKNGQVLGTPFLNAPASPPDRAMSGLAFHPDFPANRKFYVITGEAVPNGSTPHYSAPQDDEDSAFDNVLVEYRVSLQNPDIADPSTRRELLRVHQAHRLHNMNDLCFGGDGFLYIAMGDGGTTRDGTPTHYNTNAPQTTNPFGKVLRIDVDELGTNGRYRIPPDNPFADGAAGNLPEIFAWGLRNPWRISADRITGEIYTGVNGDVTIEQIYRVQLGENYGWDSHEGSYLWNPITGEATVDPSPDPELTPPLAEYDHNNSQPFGSAIGGYVYRGAAMSQFRGTYLFHDWVAAELIAMDPATGALSIVAVDPDGASLRPSYDICWGEDDAGELYIGRADGLVLKLGADPTGVPDVATAAAVRAVAVPNPSRGETSIVFELARPGRVALTIFDVTGRRIARVRSGWLESGPGSLIWSGRTERGALAPAGVYGWMLHGDGWQDSGKIVRLP